jgi:hypothetical protein
MGADTALALFVAGGWGGMVALIFFLWVQR